MSEWLDISSVPDELVIRIRDAEDGSPEGVVVAQCFPVDIGAQAKTIPELLDRLAAVWRAEAEYAKEKNAPLPVLPGDDDCRSEERAVSSPSAASRERDMLSNLLDEMDTHRAKDMLRGISGELNDAQTLLIRLRAWLREREQAPTAEGADAPGREVTPDLLKQLGMFYHCRAHCSYQDGSDSKAPTLLFAGADYEATDGSMGLREDAKYVNEPAIIYVRLDSYLDGLNVDPVDLEWSYAERQWNIRLSERLDAAIKRIETIAETHPELELGEDLAYYREVALAGRPVSSADGEPNTPSNRLTPRTLNWFNRPIGGTDCWFGRTPFGSYRVQPEESGKWIVVLPSSSLFMSRKRPELIHPTREDAQAWVQSDFERRTTQCFPTDHHDNIRSKG